MKDASQSLEQYASEYWRECIHEAMSDAGIVAREDQKEMVALIVEGAHEVYAESTGALSAPNPYVAENRELEARLREERDKVVCPECRGDGRETVNTGLSHVAVSDCWKCSGEGKVTP